ncbi:MAG: hypothetical protein PF689_13000 [Deltaproteobacteria bacterium]|jgi:hypothetical protein|nr:hypothetical protein [Deltaproteobacteria bacterium]
MNFNRTKDSFDSLIAQALKKRGASRAPLSKNEILAIAQGEKEIPSLLDSGERDTIELLREIIYSSEDPAIDNKSSFLELLSFKKTGATLKKLFSSFELNLMEPVVVRGEPAVNKRKSYQGRTSQNTQFSVQVDRDKITLCLAWEKAKPPHRINLKKNNRLLDSMPVQNNEINLPLSEEGAYILELITDNEVKETICFSF